MSRSLYFARQPILDVNGHTYAYELLFRNSLTGTYACVDDDRSATAQVLVNTLNYVDLKSIIGDCYAFVNIDESILLDDMVLSIPKEQFVLELLETVIINEEVLQRVAMLKEMGYRFALDDIDCSKEYIQNFQPVFKYIDILKLDITLMDEEMLPRYLALFKQFDMKLLAEKVETQEEFDKYKAFGCDLFQGFFFAKPDIIENKRLDPEQILILNLISQLRQDADINKICQNFEQNAALTLQLLRFINSAAFSFKTSIKSIRQAIMLIGPEQLKSWLLLISYANPSSDIQDKVNPLLYLAQTRSNMMQTISKAFYKKSCNGAILDKAAFIGLLSLVDALFQMPIEPILKELNIDHEISSSLIDYSGDLGSILELICAVEIFDTKVIEKKLSLLKISHEEFSKAIEEAYEITESFASSLKNL
ncbi:EAL domain-containing protein [Sulfurimonas sp. MAG313]|nr:EAL domain-containing protein [Sulfurimonas sp. MAG313]MDF1880374.1 EAL domain-containing protein [Sulfurimonas sp. MAG313]